MSDVWHYADGDIQRGPVGLDALRALVRAGRLTPDSLVWREGMGQWAPASSQVPQVFKPAEQAVRAQSLSYAEPELNAASAPARLVEILAATRPWTRFCGVVTVVCGALCGVLTFLLVIGFLTNPEAAVFISGVLMAGLTGLLLPAGISMNRIASRMALLTATGRSNDLESALDAQRAFWRLAGFLLIAAAGLLVVTFILGGVFGSSVQGK
jgi:hypothetical protein